MPGITREWFFYITTACQLRCKTCYVGQHLSTPTKPIVLEQDEMERTLRALLAAGARKGTFLGGEPTLIPGFERTLRFAREIGHEFIRVDTNGVASSRRFFQTNDLSAVLSDVMVTIDGLEEAHDAIRGRGTFRQATHTIRSLRERGYRVRVTTTVTSRSIDDMHRLGSRLHSLGVYNWNLHLVSMTGFAHANPDLQVSPSRWLQFRQEAETWKFSGMRFDIPTMFGTIREHRAARNNRCFAASGEVINAIPGPPDADGKRRVRIYGCPLVLSDFHSGIGQSGTIGPDASIAYRCDRSTERQLYRELGLREDGTHPSGVLPCLPIVNGGDYFPGSVQPAVRVGDVFLGADLPESSLVPYCVFFGKPVREE